MNVQTLDRAQTAKLMLDRRYQIIDEWLKQVRQAIPISRQHPDHIIIDSLPQYLEEFAGVLVDVDGEIQHIKRLSTAREHGETRTRLGYTVREVAYEYMILREVILKLTSGSGTLLTEASAALNRINDAGSIDAVEEFLKKPLVDAVQARSIAEAANKQLSAFFMRAPEPMVIMSGPDHLFTVANQPYVDFIGRDPVGKTVRQVFTEDEAGAFFGLLDEVYRTGVPFVGKELPFRRPLPTGELEDRWINVGYYPAKDLNNQIHGIHAFVFDVTEQVAARTRVEASEARVRRYAEAMPQMAFIADANGEITYFNQRYYDYIGIPKDTGKGREWESQPILHPDDLQRTIERWGHSVKTGEPYEIEYRIRRHDGVYRWHLGRAVADKDAAGDILEWLGTNTDVHDVKVAADEVEASARLLRLTTDSLPVLISYIDTDLVYRFVNSAYEKWFNLKPNYFVGKRVADIVGPDVFAKIKSRFDRVMNGESFEFEETANYPHGTREIRVNYTPDINAQTGKVRGIVALVQDITDQKKFENELQLARQTADTANDAKSAFLANMSHEIRSPLGAIMGFADLARVPGAATADINSHLAVVERNSIQVLRIIDDILDLAKVEAGRVLLEKVQFSLTEFLADFGSLMGFKARENGIEFMIKAETDLPDLVISDSTRLRQILTNAVGNAIKFTRHGFVNLKVSYRRGDLRFDVTDTGRGISDEQSESLFQAFVQADPSTTRKYGGTGLGLVLTRRLCQLMGGDYVLEKSTLGVGSTFVATVKIELPAQVTLIRKTEVAFTMPKPAVPHEGQNRLSGIKILLVEDSPDNQVLVRFILEKQGAVVTIAHDGAEGVERALSLKYDVVLMDIQMPVLDGHQAVRKLRESNYRGPVIALTAHAMVEEAVRAFASGFSGFLSKPIQRDALITKVQEAAQKI